MDVRSSVCSYDVLRHASSVDAVTGLGDRRKRVCGSTADRAKEIIFAQKCRPPSWPTRPPNDGNSFFGV
jgi:hypothetical protein